MHWPDTATTNVSCPGYDAVHRERSFTRTLVLLQRYRRFLGPGAAGGVARCAEKLWSQSATCEPAAQGRRGFISFPTVETAATTNRPRALGGALSVWEEFPDAVSPTAQNAEVLPLSLAPIRSRGFGQDDKILTIFTRS